jgi:hypothetical protein
MAILSSGVKTETTIPLKKSKIENLFAFRREGILHLILPTQKNAPKHATSQNREIGQHTHPPTTKPAQKQTQSD